MEHSKPAAGHKADTVPDEDDRCVLEKHFLQGKSYTVISLEMKYDKDYVYKKIKKALKQYRFLKVYYEVLRSTMLRYGSIILEIKYKPDPGDHPGLRL